MKFLILILPLILQTCNFNNKVANRNKYGSFYIGTYTDGDSKGIYKYELNKKGILRKIGLVAQSENPSYLALSHDKKYLITVNEIDTEGGSGSIESYKIIGDSLKFISKSSSGGAHPCFVTTNFQDFVLTANYNGGNVSLHRLNNIGELSEILDLQQHHGQSITDRQKSPHAHSSWFNGDDIISVDLGTDELWLSKLDSLNQKIVPANPDKIAMKPGDGPRHLAFHPNKKWIYVINELSSSISLIQKDNNGELVHKKSFSTLPKHFNGTNSCADIHISTDGKFLYASNRGFNTIAVFKIDKQGGSLKLIEQEPCLGDGPRNFSLSPKNDYLLVANQITNNIVSFKRDFKTGMLEFVHQIKAESPVCILFI